MVTRFEQAQGLNTVVGVVLGLVAILFLVIALVVAVDLGRHATSDPTVLPFIFVPAILGVSALAAAVWVSRRAYRHGLILEIGDVVGFQVLWFFGGRTTGAISWGDVEKIIYTDAPRRGEWLRFYAHDRSVAWHGQVLPLRGSDADMETLLPVLDDSARRVGLKLDRVSLVSLVVYTRAVWQLSPSRAEA
ncbi:MAG: hypothetical protein AAF566_04900 [Pseudomonadota bacterium]